MEELIKITKSKGGKDVVSARELHNLLNIGADFTSWIKRMIEYGFKENADYVKIPFTKNGEPDNQQVTNPNPKVDYAITIDMAKHIAMVQRSSVGRMVRQWFIDRENKLKEVEQSVLPTNYLSALKQLVAAEEEKLALAETIKEQTPKVEYYEKVLSSDKTYTTTQIAALLDKSAIWLNKQLVSKGIQYKHRDSYLLYAAHKGKGYEFIRTSVYEDNSGVNHTRHQLEWTEEGKEFIMKAFNQKLIL